MHVSGIVGFFHYTQTKSSSPLATDAQTQQGFIDERAPCADPSRIVDDDQDDEMSEPQNKPEPQRRELRRFKMSPFCFKRSSRNAHKKQEEHVEEERR